MTRSTIDTDTPYPSTLAASSGFLHGRPGSLPRRAPDTETLREIPGSLSDILAVHLAALERASHFANFFHTRSSAYTSSLGQLVNLGVQLLRSIRRTRLTPASPGYTAAKNNSAD